MEIEKIEIEDKKMFYIKHSNGVSVFSDFDQFLKRIELMWDIQPRYRMCIYEDCDQDQELAHGYCEGHKKQFDMEKEL